MRLEFRLLGPLEATADEEPVDLGPRMQRAVLALLLLDAGRVVPLDRIIDGLWAGEAPSSATGTLQAYISQLRRTLEPDRAPRTPPTVVLTRPPGYLLAVEPDQVDALRFRAEVAAGRARLAKGDPAAAAELLRAALARWRGDPLAEFAGEEFARVAAVRLVEERAAAVEELTEALLATGEPGPAAGEARSLLAEQPYRERAWGQLMLALYREGRQADALAAFRDARQRLDDELGLPPGPALRALEERILRHDPSLELAIAPANPSPAVVEPAPAPSPGLVGRRTQLRRAGLRLAAASSGQGGLLLVTGEAGVGKTAFAEAVAELAPPDSMPVAWTRCVEGSATPPFWPWIQLLRTLPGAAAVLETLQGQGSTPHDDPESARFQLHEAILAALRKAGPRLVVIEDIHAADIASLLALAYVGTALGELPVLVLATMRPDAGPDLTDALAALANERGFERLPLAGFSTDEVFDFLRERVGTIPDASVVRALAERTGGNPFYLTEVVRLLGAENPTGWGSAEAIRQAGVPEGVRDVIGRRVARLPAATQEILRTAAVIGRDVDLTLLEQVAGCDDEAVLSALEPALMTGLVVEVPEGWDYRFSHALVAEALYAQLSPLRRARVHRAIGEALEAREGVPDAGRLGQLTHHFTRAARIGTAGKAVEYAIRAARLAAAQLAYDQAVRLLGSALSTVDPRGPDAAATRGRLLVQLGQAQRASGDQTTAQATLEEAIAVGRSLGDDTLVIDAVSVFGGVANWVWRAYGTVDEAMVAVLEEQLARLSPARSRERAILLGTLGVELVYSARYPEGERFAAEAVTIARQLGDVALRARTLNNYALASSAPETEPAARAALDEALGLDLPRTVELVALMQRMRSATAHGQIEVYDRDLARARRLVSEIPIPEHIAHVGVCEAGRSILSGAFDEAERLAETAFAQLQLTNLYNARWIRMILLYTCRRFTGRATELVEEIVDLAEQPHQELLRPSAVLAAAEAGRTELAHALIERWGAPRPHNWAWDLLTLQWALVAARLGTPDPAALYRDLIPFADRFSVIGSAGGTWGSLHYPLAELAHRLGDPETAVAHAEAGLAAHRRLGAPHLVALSQAQLRR